jgi:hypothetical protein
MKFKVKKVFVFSYKGKDYHSGDIVDISEEDAKRLTPADFLEPIQSKSPEEPKKQKKK